ncbi:MAG TPA: hypothetical protein ENN05_10900 [Deltaproteobacteria bacterium]|nr:hypothetical protein [Deltaproteobacteria bacterium]
MLLEWIRFHETLIGYSVGLSLSAFVLTLIIIPFLVVRMPKDYFTYNRGDLKRYHRQHITMRIMLLVLKNVCGYIFILAGLAMLVLPGQGIITILIGITLISFPKKRDFECRIIRIKAVERTINWMRAKAHQGPIDLPSRAMGHCGQEKDIKADK